jgi:transposase
MRKTTKSPIAFIRAALKAAEVLPLYSHPNSPHKFTQRQLFAILALKDFYKLDYRGVVEMIRDLKDLAKALGLKHIPTHNALWYAHRRILSDLLATRLFDQTVNLGRPTGERVSVDSTGLDSSHASRYYVKRCGKDLSYKTYPKMSNVVDNDTHLMLSAVIDEGPKVDQVEFKQAVREAHRRCPFKQLIADAAYDSEANHQFIRERLHADSVIRPRNRPGCRPPQTPYRAQMHSHFPREAYGQRWQIESTYSQFKRTLGSALGARSHERRARQLMLRVITFNIMLILLRRYFPHVF